MKGITSIDIIGFTTDPKTGKCQATVSYCQNVEFDHCFVPVNFRPLQLSARDNVLVDQSVKSESIAKTNP